MKNTTIVINGKQFTYQDEINDLTHETISAIREEQAQALLSRTKDLFSTIGLDFYLGFGTLLGAVRDKTLIKGDEDVDVIICDEDKLFNSLPYLAENKFCVCRIIKHTLYSFRIGDNSYIDVYILRNLRWSVWAVYCIKLAFWYVPKKFFREYQDINFLGVQCKCPKEPEKLLEFWYGKTWRTPVRGHNFIYEVKSAYYWHKIKDKVKSIIKVLIGYKHWKRD